MRFLLLFLPAFFILANCHSGKTDVENINVLSERDTSSGQKDLNLLTDSIPMPILGVAQNQKGGAVLDTDNGTYWIDGLDYWNDYLVGQPIRVWGEVVVRNDNPVFLDTGVIVSQGIPVESEEELRAKQQRTWIVNARYELVRP